MKKTYAKTNTKKNETRDENETGQDESNKMSDGDETEMESERGQKNASNCLRKTAPPLTPVKRTYAAHKNGWGFVSNVRFMSMNVGDQCYAKPIYDQKTT